MKIERAAVLGAGTMGARIAAHLANAGVPTLLLDVTSELARKGLEAAVRSRPPAFYRVEDADLITTGSFTDDLPSIARCDWVIEAVTEDLDIKRALYSDVARHRTPGSIVSTNTSGIPLHRIAQGQSTEFKQHFCGTHFFNPPRYLHLLEMIPCEETLPAVLETLHGFCDLRLGKGVVPCKDTPNFIANRLGAFFSSTVQSLTVDMDLSIEEVDSLTGPAIGLPRSASYRLLDIVGLDVWVHLTRNHFNLAPFVLELVGRGWLGDKSGQGFYKRTGKDREIDVLDWKTFEYRTAVTPRFGLVSTAGSLDERLRRLVAEPGVAGEFVWRLLSEYLLYSASLTPEISDRVIEMDRAMRWGYAHTFGPFEMWDALGFRETARRMESEGRLLPAPIQAMLAGGVQAFYRYSDQDGEPRREYFDFASKDPRYRLEYARPGILVLSDLKRARGVLRKNAAAALVDLGDGCLCYELLNDSLPEDAAEMLDAAREQLGRSFRAMVVSSDRPRFPSLDWSSVRQPVVGVGTALLPRCIREGEGGFMNPERFLHEAKQLALQLAK